MLKRLQGLTLAASILVFGSAGAQEVTLVVNPNVIGAPTFNPLKATVINTQSTLIFDTLVQRDRNFSYHPALALSWESSGDGLTWTFKLKEGVKFHDGEPFNGEAVKWWLEAYRGSQVDNLVDAIATIDVPDPYTVKLNMKRPDPNLLFNLSSSWMGFPSPKAVKEMGEDYGVKGAVGTGPFILEEHVVGQYTVLRRNPDYTWGGLSQNKGPARIARITMREIAEQSTAFLELKTGGVDALLYVPTDFVPQVKAEANLAMVELMGSDVMYMPINVTSGPFADIRIREAVALAIDQKEILQGIFKGVGMEAHNFLISALSESKVDPKYNIGYNPERAKKLLDEAGWPVGSDGTREKDGKPFTVKLWAQSESEFKRVAEAVQAQLAAVGIKAEVTTFDSSTIREQYKANNHQLAIRSYSWPNADILNWFFGGARLGYPNVSMWNDAKAEELGATAQTGSRTPEERLINYTKYHEYVLSQFVFAPIYQPVQFMAYNKARIRFPDKIMTPEFDSVMALDMEIVE